METTRRRFLGGLAVATALSGAATSQAIASASAENSDLLQLGVDFSTANERFTAICDRLPPLQEAYRLIAPAIPADLVVTPGAYAWYRNFADFFNDPADPNGKRVKSPKGYPLEVVQAYRIEAGYGATFGTKSPVLADFTDADEEDLRLYRIAQSFEADVQSALTVSGLQAAIVEYQDAETDLRRIIFALCAIRAKTTEGVALKVRATAAYAAFGADERFTASQMLARAVWEDMGEDA